VCASREYLRPGQLDPFRLPRAQFLSGPNRKAILAEVGLHYFGPRVPAEERRKHAKQLFNALDNDGSLLGWLSAHGCATAPPPAFELSDGTVLDLGAYIDTRAELTAEFQALMPGMNAFVAAWLHAQGDSRAPTHERTAKSYFLQEAEGLSRWAKLRGDTQVTNLQRDGVVVDLPDGIGPVAATVGLSAASILCLVMTNLACGNCLPRAAWRHWPS